MITSASNSRIKQVSALVRKSREREETGLFTAEGVRIFSEIPENLLKEVYVSESFEKENQAFLAGRDYETVSDSVFEKLCDTKTPQGILAVVKKPEADFSVPVPSSMKRPLRQGRMLPCGLRPARSMR